MDNLKIGLSQRILSYNNNQYDSSDRSWYTYLKNYQLSFLPNRLDQDFDQISSDIDVFIITGGDDSFIRRSTELRLATYMILKNKPVLGICHGCFLLSEVLGGTIVNKSGHSNGVEHFVKYNDTDILVNSYHSLTISKIHNSGKILAVDSDGDCEAWIDGNIAGVVWHPERMSQAFLPDEIQEIIFHKKRKDN